MDWNDAIKQWAPLRDLMDRANKVPELERRISELERKLAAPPCPRCHLPTWTLAESEPDKTFGDLGGSENIYRCASCGFEVSKLET